MLRIPSKTEWQLIVDFTFIRNRMPENTPVNFRCSHTKGFLHLLHPNLDIDDDGITMEYGHPNISCLIFLCRSIFTLTK